MARKNLEIPVWRKYTLHIGEKRLRQIIKDNPVADYLLWNGTHVLIKRKLFEQYIDIVEAV